MLKEGYCEQFRHAKASVRVGDRESESEWLATGAGRHLSRDKKRKSDEEHACWSNGRRRTKGRPKMRWTDNSK